MGTYIQYQGAQFSVFQKDVPSCAKPAECVRSFSIPYPSCTSCVIFKTTLFRAFFSFIILTYHVHHSFLFCSDDCGVFAMKIMEVWTPLVDVRKIFSSEDIPNIRIQYMTQMFFWARNSVDKSLATDFQFEVDFYLFILLLFSVFIFLSVISAPTVCAVYFLFYIRICSFHKSCLIFFFLYFSQGDFVEN